MVENDDLDADNGAVNEFICDVCGRSFAKRSSLSMHKLMHSDHDVSCDICGRSFKCLRSLRYHTTLVHDKSRCDNDNKAVCEECGRSFASRPGLKRHIYRQHTKHDPCVCGECGRPFMSKASLATHARMAHRTRYGEFPCGMCGKVCVTESALKQHFSVMHDEDVSGRIAERRARRMRDPKFLEWMREHARETIMTEESVRKRSKTFAEVAKTEAYRKMQRDAQLRRYREHPEYRDIISDRMHSFFSSLDSEGWEKWESEHNIRGRRSWEVNKSGDSVFCASSFESSFCRSARCDDSVSDFRRCGAKILYYMDDVERVYFPDFSVDMVDGSRIVIETKDDRMVDDPVVVAKADAASRFFSENGIDYAIMTSVDLKRYSENHDLRSTLGHGKLVCDVN